VQQSDIQEAARLLVNARDQKRLLDELPAHARPRTFAEAAAIQNETARLLDEQIVGYKVAGTDPEQVMWGAVLQSRLLRHPAEIPTSAVPLLGVEGEIAFELKEDITATHRNLTLEEFDSLVAVLPAVEVVDSRFVSYSDTPIMDRTADFMSNGALIRGEPWVDSNKINFSKLPITLSRNGIVLDKTVGGHSAGDPRLPALAFIRAEARPDFISRGTVLTTGTFTGLKFVKPGDLVSAFFEGFGEIAVRFTL
jgi:2-keto-4-pentenoate hydratase